MLFCREPPEVSKNERLKYIVVKTEGGMIKGKLTFYCRMLHVSRQAFYKYLQRKDRPWKYQKLADAMRDILKEDECNDTYGRSRMRDALLQKKPKDIDIPSERTVYRVMKEIGISHRTKRKPNGITKADKAARKSDDLLKRDFRSTEPLTKCVTDITEIKSTNMKAPLCARTLRNAHKTYPGIEGAICHSDRGVHYTSDCYRRAVRDCHITQSMNSDGGRCHDNARCESMWARMKSERLYNCYDTEKMTVTELKELIWRYYMSYWNNRRICSANDGLPPMVKRQQYDSSLQEAA